MEIDKIKKRLTKLLALSASPVEAEAEAAMKKCQELMAKYGIRTIDIDEENRTANVKDASVDGTSKQVTTWESTLAAAIAQCLDGKSIIDKTPTGWQVMFIAGNTEIEIIIDLFKRVRRVISKKAKEYAAINIGNTKTLKHNYSVGMVSTIYTRLKNIYVDTPSTTALVVIKKDAINTHIKKVVGPTVKRTSNATIRDEQAYRSGMRDGHNVVLNQSIGANKSGAIA